MESNQLERSTGGVKQPQPKSDERAKVLPRSKEQEIESIKRTLYNAIDKLEKLTTR
jgi:hypothetical protein